MSPTPTAVATGRVRGGTTRRSLRPPRASIRPATAPFFAPERWSWRGWPSPACAGCRLWSGARTAARAGTRPMSSPRSRRSHGCSGGRPGAPPERAPTRSRFEPGTARATGRAPKEPPASPPALPATTRAESRSPGSGHPPRDPLHAMEGELLAAERASQGPTGFGGVQDHPDAAMLSEHAQDPALLFPLGNAVHPEELVERKVKKPRVFAQQPGIMLEQGDCAVVLLHVGHHPGAVQPHPVLAKRGLAEVALLLGVDHGLARDPPALQGQVRPLPVDRIGEHRSVATDQVAGAVDLRDGLVAALGDHLGQVLDSLSTLDQRLDGRMRLEVVHEGVGCS